ncbi:ethanolaminephosphotransferase 1-like [Tiliqua scincoides]|uniref:ethanolaminephosphotransferase 1-like n=1 Tax=Tiliqua scincoides TaxID=71010 RepID=UPI003462B5E9
MAQVPHLRVLRRKPRRRMEMRRHTEAESNLHGGFLAKARVRPGGPAQAAKYSAVDTNPLSIYVMQPLWDKIVKIVPLWIAPNLLTFTGFVMLLINYFILSFYDWDYSASGSSPGLIPRWVLVFCAFTTFFAYALDAIDGKHARRTQSSSPLGELFDHGLDSWAVSVLLLTFFSIPCSHDSGKAGLSVSTIYSLLSVILLTFMFSHWEKYNTGILFLPWSYDISQVAAVSLYLMTAILGIDVWHRPFIFGYCLTEIIIFQTVCCSVLSLPQTLYNIHVAYGKKTLQKDSLYEGLLPLFSPVLLFALLTTWVSLSPCKILVKQPRLFLWMTGVTFSNVMCRMIICQMTNTRVEVLHWLLIPLAVMVYTATAGYQGRLEEPILIVFAIFVTAAHVHYGVCVGKQLSQHFNIYIFSLKKRVQE